MTSQKEPQVSILTPRTAVFASWTPLLSFFHSFLPHRPFPDHLLALATGIIIGKPWSYLSCGAPAASLSLGLLSTHSHPKFGIRTSEAGEVP